MNITNEYSGWVSASQLTEDELTMVSTRLIVREPLKDKQNGQSLTEQYAESMLDRSVAPSSTASSPKTRDSSHKVPVNLCPASAIIAIALVIAQGHKKPGRTIYNWRSQPISYMMYEAAVERHLLKYRDGEEIDQELSELASDGVKDTSGNWLVPIKHTWAAMSNLAIIEDARQSGTLIDDRPIKGGAANLLSSITIGPNNAPK